MAARPIALLTDFGYTDAYAGVMKGVVLSRVPDARIFDLTHGVPPQNVRAGALQLLSAVPYCPSDCVFLAVVDPGVGSERRPLCLESGGRWFVGPDNGLLWLAAASVGEPRAWGLNRSVARLGPLSATFHGRDIFAPVAAALASGASPESLGIPIENPVRLELPPVRRVGSEVQGEVILVDGFGNAVTNLRPADLDDPAPGSRIFTAGGQELRGPSTHYGSVTPGEGLIVLGSLGFYEVAVNGGSAAQHFGLCEGDSVSVRSRNLTS